MVNRCRLDIYVHRTIADKKRLGVSIKLIDLKLSNIIIHKCRGVEIMVKVTYLTKLTKTWHFVIIYSVYSYHFNIVSVINVILMLRKPKHQCGTDIRIENVVKCQSALNMNSSTLQGNYKF